MLSKRLFLTLQQSSTPPAHLVRAVQGRFPHFQERSFASSHSLQARKDAVGDNDIAKIGDPPEGDVVVNKKKPSDGDGDIKRRKKKPKSPVREATTADQTLVRRVQSSRPKKKNHVLESNEEDVSARDLLGTLRLSSSQVTSLKEALLQGSRKSGEKGGETGGRRGKKGTEMETETETGTDAVKTRRQKSRYLDPLRIESIVPKDLDFQAVDVKVPPIPMLSYGLDRVIFNKGVYRLQDPRSRVYNFDPYLEKIMSVDEFDFTTLSQYKTSSQDDELLAITKRLNTKFTGSTSSMSGVLQHFHYVISAFRSLNHDMLSRDFPDPSQKFTKVTLGPDAIFLRWKDGVYAIDADKSYDRPNIMSWLGQSLEKLLTTERHEFERYRRSSPEESPKDDDSGRCYHYSTLGNVLMRSQLDAHDPRLPGTGVFDLKTRAVVSIRMDHTEFETGSGYQLRFDRGQWESFEREFYDMSRATMLKYSLQVRMGRMDGIFVAYHNIERLFGFQYLSLADLDEVLHGQTDPCLGDQEFKLSISLLDELLQKATTTFPETTLRLHFHARGGRTPFIYVFAEPVTDEQADEMQRSGESDYKAFERDIMGVKHDDPDMQNEWHNIQNRVDDEVDADEINAQVEETEEETKKAVRNKKGSPTEKPDVHNKGPKVSKKAAEKPLMGWTLAIRNRVNGEYMDRPEKLEPDDRWTVEYHIQEIPEEARWGLYNKVKDGREKLIGTQKEENTKGLDHYRSIIRRYSEKGRKWRELQDQVDEQMGQQVYRPLGPGS